MLGKTLTAIGSLSMCMGFLASSGLAQNQMRHQVIAQATGEPTGVEVVTLTGLVTSVKMAPGQGMPSVALHTSAGDVTILLGPYWLVVDKKIEIQENQVWSFKAIADPHIANGYVATEVQDPATKAWIVLRDNSGMPHMGAGPMGVGRGRGAMGGGAMAGMRGRGGIHNAQGADVCGHAAANVDFKSRITVSGTVLSTDMVAGQGFPTIVISASGVDTTILASPFQAIMRAGFKVSQGDHLTIVGYPLVNVANTYLAAELQIGQNILKLRDENGFPLMSGGRGPMRGIRR